MRRDILCCILLLLCGTIVYARKQISAASPDGQIRVTISLSDRIYYDVEDQGDRSQKILKEADYVARTKGNRSFPWRYMLIS